MTRTAFDPDRDPFHDVARTSLAYKELLRQRDAAPPDPDRARIAALTGDYAGPPVFDLERIYRAALADATNPETIGRRRWLSPRRFVNGWSNWVTSRDDRDGRILVDEEAADVYTQRLDDRVMDASYEAFRRRKDAAVGADPIGAALRACTASGPGGWLFAAPAAALAAGMSIADLGEAVLERARAEAAGLDDLAAETLLASVHQAIGGPPR